MNDSLSVKKTEADGPGDYDAGKEGLGRKRNAMVDTGGRALMLHVHPASVQDRDGAVLLLPASRSSFPFVEQGFADNAYAGELVASATRIAVEIVRKAADPIAFAVYPRCPVVERCFAWLGRNFRLAKKLRGDSYVRDSLPLRRLSNALC